MSLGARRWSSKAGRCACSKLGLALASVMAAMLLVTPLMPFGAVSDAAAAEVPTLRYGMDESIDHLNPFIGINDNSRVFYGLIYDYLVAIDEDLNPKPNLATSWNVVKDIVPVGSVWQYNLTRNAYWHDGEPFTADDVVFTFEYQTGPNWTTMWAYQPYTIVIPQGGVEKLDDYTARIHFTDFEGTPAVCSFGHSLMVPIVPEHIWKDISPSEAGFSYPNYFPIGTGPFMCTEDTKDEWLTGDRMILYRNPNYHGAIEYGQEVKFERLIIEFYEEPMAMVTDLRNGAIDVAALDAAIYDGLLAWLDVNPGMKANIGTFEGLKCTGHSIEIAVCMKPNARNNLRLDPAVRQAMAHATDKEFIRDHIYMGFAEVGSALMSPIYDYWHWAPTPEEEYYYNISRANEILDAAGYVWSGDVRVAGPGNPYAPQGTSLSFEIVVEVERFEDRQSALFLQEEWANAGIRITLYIVSPAEWGRVVYGAAYDLTITYWSGDPDPSYLLFVTSSFALEGWSESFYSSPEFDENYTNQLLTVDPALRRPFVTNCQRHLYQDAAMMVTVYLYGCYAWREDRFQGWGDWGLHPGRAVSNFWTANDLWFDLELLPSTNTPPLASFTVSPEIVTLPGSVAVDASASSDAEDDASALLVRWDWEDDGTWDTDYSLVKAAENSYPSTGTYTVRLEVKDTGELTSTTTRQVEVIGDTQAPVTNISLAGVTGSAGWYVFPVIVTLEAEDDRNGVAETWYRIITLDSGTPAEWTEYTGAFVISVQGNVTVEYYSLDLAGNSEAVRNATVKLDTLAPVIGCNVQGSSLVPGWHVSSVAAEVVALDAPCFPGGCSGVSAVCWRLNAGSWEEYDGTIMLGAEGDHMLEFYAVDVAGNEGAAMTLRIRIDTTPPTLTMLQEQGIVFASGDVSVWWDSFDTVSGLNRTEVSVDGSPFAPLGDLEHYVSALDPLATCLNLTGLEDGEHFVVVSVRDNAGHVTERRLDFAMDTDATGRVLGFGWTFWAVLLIICIIVALSVTKIFGVRRVAKEAEPKAAVGEIEAARTQLIGERDAPEQPEQPPGKPSDLLPQEEPERK